MLIYFGFGNRNYHDNPIPVFTRDRWEFQIVLNGEIALVDRTGPGFLKSRHLWLSRPEFPHGWTGIPGATAEVAVFHFASLPKDLERRIPNAPFISSDLSPEACNSLRALAETVARYWRSPLPGRFLYFEKAKIDLSILLHECLVQTDSEEPFDMLHHRRAIRAMAWFGEHLERNPSLNEVCAAIGVSPSQLRRDFNSSLQTSPKKIFADIRLKAALEILERGDEPIELIAEKCGYLSASALSRAFKAKFGKSPRKVLPRKNISRPASVGADQSPIKRSHHLRGT